MTSPDEVVQKSLEIIGEAISLEPEDLQDHETWTFLGLGTLLQSATASDLTSQIGVKVTPEDFTSYPNVGAFKSFLRLKAAGKDAPPPTQQTNGAPPSSSSSIAQKSQPLKQVHFDEPADPWEGVPKPKVPLSAVLQGKTDVSETVIFLFPDGSGAGTAYGMLPSLGTNVCLVGLNSPFLRQANEFQVSIERMARLWVEEVRKLQPEGKPYILGGWSAGGYYAFEVAKLLVGMGEKVERLVLIDSPCRLVYEALPVQVVDQLTKKGLMGATVGGKKAPDWLVQHFTSTVISVDQYMPTPMEEKRVPKYVNFIWVREGLVSSVEESGLEVDMDVKVTKFLLEPRPELKSEGWERLLPGAKCRFEYMTGNHFQITQPPHVSLLGVDHGVDAAVC